MQVNNRLLDDFARLTSGALGLASNMRGEAETIIRERLRRLLADMDLVSREEFDAVRAMAAKARAEQEGLEARVRALEARPAKPAGAGKATAKKPASKSGPTTAKA